jgi:hypothetical protein
VSTLVVQRNGVFTIKYMPESKGIFLEYVVKMYTVHRLGIT